MRDPQMIGDMLVVAIVATKGLVDWTRGTRRDRRHASVLNEKFSSLDLSLERRFGQVALEMAQLDASVAEVRAFVVGPDGENGIRGDVRSLGARFDDMEERERQRDRDRERDRVHGAYDRRSVT
jgi:hypothetical protein